SSEGQPYAFLNDKYKCLKDDQRRICSSFRNRRRMKAFVMAISWIKIKNWRGTTRQKKKWKATYARGRINELEGDVARIQGYVQKGNANLRKCQHKLDTALIREKVLEGEIWAKEILMKKKNESLKDTYAKEDLNTEITKLQAQVANLEVAIQA
ncbi:hypothetical protein GIB67_035761, partial [Kingdonia uniflora]